MAADKNGQESNPGRPSVSQPFSPPWSTANNFCLNKSTTKSECSVKTDKDNLTLKNWVADKERESQSENNWTMIQFRSGNQSFSFDLKFSFCCFSCNNCPITFEKLLEKEPVFLLEWHFMQRHFFSWLKLLIFFYPSVKFKANNFAKKWFKIITDKVAPIF